MNLHHVKGYFRDTTLHGFRYLVDEGSFLVRLTWLALIVTSFVVASLSFLTSLQEARDNPFVTTLDSVPVQEVPFPAVTVQPRLRRPSTEFLTRYVHSLGTTRFVAVTFFLFFRVFNNVEVDCLTSKEKNCDFRTKMSKKLFSAFIEKEANGSFDFAQWPGTTDKLRSKIICSKFWDTYNISSQDTDPDWLTGTISLMAAKLKNMSSAIGEDSLRELNRDIWLSSIKLRLKALSDFLELDLTLDHSENTIEDCWNSVDALDEGNQENLFKWTTSQGGNMAQPPVPLGEVLFPHYGSLAFSSEEIKNIMNKIFDSLALEKELSMIPIQNYAIRDDILGLEDNTYQNWTCTGQEMERYFNDRHGRTVPFCQPSKNHLPGCCQMERKLNRNYRNVLRHMKYSLAPESWHIEARSEVRDLREALAATKLTSYPKPGRTTQTYFPTVFSSKYLEGKDKPTPWFFRTFGTKGISYTFNAGSFWSIYKQTPKMMEIYEEVLAKDTNLDRFREEMFYVNDTGPFFGFTALINVFPKRNGAFRDFTIHGTEEIPDLRENPMMIANGKSYDIKVKASILRADSTVTSLPFEKRKCMTEEDGHDLTLFKKYSYSACKYECILKIAMDKCGCVPWNYPPIGGDSVPICHRGGQGCFEKALIPGGCDCPEDCNSVQVMISLVFVDLFSQPVFTSAL